MRTLPKDVRGVAAAATATATLMIAQQIAAKSLRDTLFLAHFSIERLPFLTISAAAISVCMVLGMSALLRRFGPGLIVPATFGLSGALYVVEWALFSVAPAVVAVSFYLHTVTFGASAASGFWGLMNERFDPHVAKRVVGRIGTGATLGGLLGGLAVWQGVQWVSLRGLLLFLVLFNAACALLLLRISQDGPKKSKPSANPSVPTTPVADGGTFYLGLLGAFVLLSGLSVALFDYVFKARAAAQYPDSADLAGFFALFYTVVGAITFVVQTAFVSKTLVRFGLPAGLSTVPGVGVVFGLGAALFFGLPSVAAMRGLGTIAENSFFRSAYELLYTPLSPERKRSTKLLIDVGADRIGTSLGGAFALGVLAMFTGVAAERTLLVAAAAIAALLLAMLVVIQRAYVAALADSMRRGTASLSQVRLQDPLDVEAIEGVVNRTIGASRAELLRGRTADAVGTAALPGGAPSTGPADNRLNEAIRTYEGQLRATIAPSPAEADAERRVSGRDGVLFCITRLRSGDRTVIQAALKAPEATAPEMVTHLLPLLNDDTLVDLVEPLLMRLAPSSVGQLYDALVTPRHALAVRSRITQILAGGAPERRTAFALTSGLNDRSFEIRHRSAVAFDRMLVDRPGLRPEKKAVFALVDLELDRADASPSAAGARPGLWVSPFGRLDESAGREVFVHIFTLLGLALDREPLLLAFQTLSTASEAPRGSALEYLENVMPSGTRDRLIGRMTGRFGLGQRLGFQSAAARALGEELADRTIDLGALRRAYAQNRSLR